MYFSDSIINYQLNGPHNQLKIAIDHHHHCYQLAAAGYIYTAANLNLNQRSSSSSSSDNKQQQHTAPHHHYYNYFFFLFQVCEELRTEDQVFPLAVNYLDRFLCSCNINKRHLQLAASVCIMLASKIRQCQYVSIETLCFYADHSITPQEIKVRQSL